MDNTEIKLKAKETGRLKFLTMMEYEISKLKCEQGVEEDKYVQERFNYLRRLREDADGAYWGLISIRPREGAELADFVKLVERIVTKVWLKDNCFWVYEQKGEDPSELGKGLHTHIMFKLAGTKHGKKQRGKMACLKELLDTCKRSNVDIEDCGVHIRVGPKRDSEQASNYLTGQKADGKKALAQEMDTLWREMYELEDVYGNETIL